MASLEHKYQKELKPIVSFDYDGVLTFDGVVNFAKILSDYRFRVVILTSRPHELSNIFQNNDDLYKTAEYLKISEKDILFTNGNFKEDYLRESKIIFHLDDCFETVKRINTISNFTRGLLFKSLDDLLDVEDVLITFIKKISDHQAFHLNKGLTRSDTSNIALAIRNRFNLSNIFHGYTCCSYKGCDRNNQPNNGKLIATKEGWVCPCGKYKQEF